MATHLTEKQTAALRSLSSGPALIPIIHFGALRDLHLVESAKEELAGQRGYAAAKLTHKGQKLIA